MVTDVEFQLEVATLLNHLFDDGELVLVQFDVRLLRQVVEGHLVQHLAIVERTDRNL